MGAVGRLGGVPGEGVGRSGGFCPEVGAIEAELHGGDADVVGGRGGEGDRAGAGGPCWRRGGCDGGGGGGGGRGGGGSAARGMFVQVHTAITPHIGTDSNIITLH